MNRATPSAPEDRNPKRTVSGEVSAQHSVPPMSGTRSPLSEQAAPGETIEPHDELAVSRAVRNGLLAEKKTLPAWLFYDDEGSRLFVKITELPEYYLGRAEQAIFEEHGPTIVRIAAAPDGAALQFAELGAGTAVKTQVLLLAAAKQQGNVPFLATDTSGSALDVAVERFAREAPQVMVQPLVARHEIALKAISDLPDRQVVLFIGSSIGNYLDEEARHLLRDIRRALRPGAVLLLGTDLRKDPATLIRAYDDAAGVTAEFNKNILTRINRELGGHFDLDCFKHVAVWNNTSSAIEMHLESTCEQLVSIDALNVQVKLRKNERIHTESSVKYSSSMIDALFAASDFERATSFYDRDQQFGVHVARAIEGIRL
ncbi:MAG: L-histidine N(alpha)-methyltransferase [Polyangiaceae bacterium]